MVKKIFYMSLVALVFLLALQSVSAGGIDLNDVNANNINLDDSAVILSSSSSPDDGLFADANSEILSDGDGEEILNDGDGGESDDNDDGDSSGSDDGGSSGNDNGDSSDSGSADAGESNPGVTTIAVNPITFDYSSEGELNISLTDENGVGLYNKTVSVKIGNSITNLTTDENGLAIFRYSNSVGVYTANVSFEGDGSYASSSTTTKITITKSSTKLKVPNVRSYLTSSTYVIVTLTDSKGNALANKKISIIISKTTYNATTNGSGMAKIKIPTKIGNFTVSVKFAGDKNYNASSASSKVVITKMKTHLFVPVVKSYITRNTYLKITLKNVYGNPLVNKTVYVVIAKKTRTLRTDANGVAKLKFAKKLGTTKCTIKFKATNNFYAASNSSKVIITKLPTVIKAPQITFKSTQYGKLIINVTDIDGKALGKKKITISIPSIKKVFKVKTNAKGIATLKFNGARSYDIVVKYAGDKIHAKKSVKSKIVIKSVKVKFNDVLGAAKLLKEYISENKSLPSKITYKNNTFTTAQLSYLMSVAIKHIAKNNKNDIVLVVVHTPKSSGEIYDTVYKKDYLKIVNKAAGSSINHKSRSYVKYWIYKVPYKVYTASFSRILTFYKENKKLPNYSLFTNSEYKKVSNSSKYTFYLTTDNIAGKKSDLKMLKKLAKALKSKGYNAVIIGIGPDIHNIAYRYGCTGKNSVLLCCFGGVDVGCIEEWGGDLSVSSRVFKENYDGAHVLGLWYTRPYGASANIHKPVGRAWDANYGFGLKNPAKYMSEHKISYIETGTVNSACTLLKAGKMGGPKLIK